ncbi:MAG: glycerophosphodiester phosphodiesterase family protein [Oscillospiraceae bacterium]|nr:glycerophosphodiester phosphodiesterase family protein [Oscillospiraceae bacterium]
MICLLIVILLILLYLFLIFPARVSAEDRARFSHRNYAHRGLYDNASERPENTLPAFEAAMRGGYGCELDVQFTSDKKLIVFHDNDYKRSSGVDKKVWEVSYDTAKQIPLFSSGETVPLFSEVLATVAGRGPLIVEVKAEGIDCGWYYEVCAETLRQLRAYKGDWCVESFHPAAVRWFKKNAPDVVRGQLVNGWRVWKGSINTLAAFLIDKLCSNVLTRPHFIAYREQDIGLPLRIAQKLGALSVAWTCRTPERQAELEKTQDAVIFEHYEPAARF